MIGDLFDSPWKILIVAVVLIVLFGSKKLPHAARSLGQSMRILKREVQGLHEDETEPGGPAQAQAQAQDSNGTANGFPAAELTAASQPDQQQSQIDALQQQIRDLQRAAAMDPAPVEVQRTQQPG
jgi:sec-independent protein translocase protein TatA